MTPRQLWREGGPVEAVEVQPVGLADVRSWLWQNGVVNEVHSHGLLLYLDGPVAADWSDWITRSAAGRIEVWDAAELRAEHRGELA